MAPSRAGGRAGAKAAAGRSLADVPQAMGPTKRQQATQGMQDALARFRARQQSGAGAGTSGRQHTQAAASGAAKGRPAAAAGAAAGGGLRPPTQQRPGLPPHGRPAAAAAVPPAKRRRPSDDYEDEYDADFIDDGGADDWRKELRSITGYDPSRFRDDPVADRFMVASAEQIRAEERRSAVLGRQADIEEERREEERRRMKAQLKKKQRKATSDDSE